MPADSSTLADPGFILLAWGSGLVLSVAYVSLSRIVGPGFTWLGAGIAFAIALPAALSIGAWWARTGLLAVAVGLVWARNRAFAGALLAVGGVALVVEGANVGGILSTVTAAMALGGVTGEMALGHWYLIDPRLPRSALRRLALTAIVGLAGDSLLLAAVGLPGGGGTLVFWLLAATSIALMAAVLAAIRYPAYSGVMAATGLSYLAVLTTLGTVFLGRALVAGLGPFS